MAAEPTAGVNIIVKVGGVAVLGQRGVTMDYASDMLDMSVKASFPNKTKLPSWEDWSVKCDGLVYINGTGSAAGFVNTIKARTEVTVLLEFGDGGEEFTGPAWMTNFSANGPHDGEATYSCDLTGNGVLVATEGA